MTSTLRLNIEGDTFGFWCDVLHVAVDGQGNRRENRLPACRHRHKGEFAAAKCAHVVAHDWAKALGLKSCPLCGRGLRQSKGKS